MPKTIRLTAIISKIPVPARPVCANLRFIRPKDKRGVNFWQEIADLTVLNLRGIKYNDYV